MKLFLVHFRIERWTTLMPIELGYWAKRRLNACGPSRHHAHRNSASGMDQLVRLEFAVGEPSVAAKMGSRGRQRKWTYLAYPGGSAWLESCREVEVVLGEDCEADAMTDSIIKDTRDPPSTLPTEERRMRMPRDNDPSTTTTTTDDGFEKLDRRVSEVLHRIDGAMLAIEDAEAALRHVRNFVGEWAPPEDPVIAFSDALSEAADCLKSAHDGDLYEAFKAVKDGLEDFEEGLAKRGSGRR